MSEDITRKDLMEAADFLRKNQKVSGSIKFIYNGKFYDTEKLTEQDKKELQPLFNNKTT